MFYTGIITTLLPYILLFGVFGTLLLYETVGEDSDTGEDYNAIHLAEHEKPAKENNITLQADWSIWEKLTYNHSENSGDNFYKDNIYGCCYNFQNIQFFHLPKIIPVLTDPALNKSYSFRGPPFLLLSI